MNQDALLPWLKSFDGVTDENCPNFESLREGHAIAIIFNQLSDKQIDMKLLLNVDRTKDDWFTCLKNLKNIYNVMKDPFSAAKLNSLVDVTGIARSKPNALLNLISMLIVFSFKSSKKAELLARLKTMPEATKQAVKSAITLQKTNSASASTPSKSAAATTSTTPNPSSSTTATPNQTPVKAATTDGSSSPTSVSSSDIRIQTIKLENEISKLEKEKKQLDEENGKLKEERDKLKSANLESIKAQNQLNEIMKQKAKEEEEVKSIDNEISSLEEFAEQKSKLQTELEAVNAHVKSLRQKASQSAPTIDDFKGSTDPTVIKLLQEIGEAEKKIKPDYIQKLQAVISKLKGEVDAATVDINEKVELLGGPELLADQPSKPDEKNPENIKVDDNNDLSASLSKEIDALNERNNKLNEEIMELMVKAEAIEKMKNQQSFLEHIRSSSIFLKPE